MSTQHYLKTWPVYWNAVAREDKNFEVRKNDRAFQAGDTLFLQCFDPETGTYTDADVLERRVTFILHGGEFGIEPGYVVMGLERVEGSV